MRVYQVACH